jgi:hypothetical protein
MTRKRTIPRPSGDVGVWKSIRTALSTRGTGRVKHPLMVVLVLGTVLDGLPLAASAHGFGTSLAACADLEMEYFPHKVLRGWAMDLDMSLMNCSTRTEVLTLVIEAKARVSFPSDARRASASGSSTCPSFPAPEPAAYTLGPRAGFGTSALLIVRYCPGHYRLKGRVLFRGRVLDRAVTAFTVLRKPAPRPGLLADGARPWIARVSTIGAPRAADRRAPVEERPARPHETAIEERPARPHETAIEEQGGQHGHLFGTHCSD